VHDKTAASSSTQTLDVSAQFKPVDQQQAPLSDRVLDQADDLELNLLSIIDEDGAQEVKGKLSLSVSEALKDRTNVESR